MNKRWQNLAELFVDYSWKKNKIEEQEEVRYELAQTKIYLAKLDLQREKIGLRRWLRSCLAGRRK